MERVVFKLTNLHLRGFLATADGVVLKGELVFSDDSPAVFVSDVCNDVHTRGPHFKLSLPVNDGGQGGTHQERTLRMTLENEDTSILKLKKTIFYTKVVT